MNNALAVIKDHPGSDKPMMDMLENMVKDENIVKIKHVERSEKVYITIPEKYEFWNSEHHIPFKLLIYLDNSIVLWRPCCC